jgi:hypothetical protein
LGETEMRACLANQLNKPDGATLVGKPEFKANYFLTCASEYSYDLGTLAQIGIGGHVLVYRLAVETNKDAPSTSRGQPGRAQSKWYAEFDCAYVVKDGKTDAFKEERYGILYSIKAVPSKIQRGHFCLDMPETGRYIQEYPTSAVR